VAIFVTGASGHIGLAVAHELAWNGHDVRGLVRTDVGAARVATHEVEPVLGTLADLELLARAAATHEVTIHCAVDHGADRWALETAALDAMIADAREARRPRLLIYTSGVWVYGTTGPRAATEDDALTPPAIVARRLDVEAQVLAAAGGNLTTAVVRPGCVYGGGGSLTAAWFAAAAAGGPVPVVDGDNRWAMIHRADLATLYRRLVEQHRGGRVERRRGQPRHHRGVRRRRAPGPGRRRRRAAADRRRGARPPRRAGRVPGVRSTRQRGQGAPRARLAAGPRRLRRRGAAAGAQLARPRMTAAPIDARAAPLIEIIAQLDRALAGADDEAWLLALDPDATPGCYAGEPVADGRHRPLRVWVELADRLGLRLRGPRPAGPGLVTVGFARRPASASAPAPTAVDPRERYGAASSFARLDKREEPGFVLDLADALERVRLPPQPRILDLGVNTGDAIALVRALQPALAARFVGAWLARSTSSDTRWCSTSSR
jgi:nucleoside-diphosphate-sugar epimerase